MTYVPFTLARDDHVPVDISFVFEHEKPAGKHGLLTVKGDQFIFEDGAPGRFWGTNFNSGANFPPHDYAEMVARRLAKFGVNIVRTHQMDAEWATPNIFQFNRARPQDHTRCLDAESLDRLDYLVYCLKQEGIYLYLDLLTYRQFVPGDAVEAVSELPQAAKPYLYFDRRLIELQKEFNQQLWTHINPYTGLAYKDDPVFVLTELVNEADFFANPVKVEPYRSRLEALYRPWAVKNELPLPDEPADFTRPDAGMARFFVEVMKEYNREMSAHLRKIGVKIPITGTNWSINLGVTAAQSEMDFTDSHCYWNYPWSNPSGTVTREPMVASALNDYAGLGLMRLAGKPFFVSEWDHAYPAEYRAESSLALAAVSAFQGWGGCTIHTYRYSTWEPENRLAGGSSAINGVVYRNFFDSFNDPAKFGLFYHAALLLRRGDVRQGKSLLSLAVEDREGWLLQRSGDLAALEITPEKHRFGLALPGETIQAESVFPAVKKMVEREAGEVFSDTGELWRSWKQRFGWVDTPRTQIAYGFLGETGKIALSTLELEVKTDYAVIACSSLTDDPLERSASILLTAVGRCENSEVVYSDDRTRMLDAGHYPMKIEAIEARLKLKSTHHSLKVLVISEHGELARKLPVKYTDGCLCFEIGPQPEWITSTMYYLIQV